MKKKIENTGNSIKNSRKNPVWLKDYQWKPGESGNEDGRPKGSLKKWTRKMFKEMPDDKKLEFIKSIPPDIVWKMAEGNPTDTINDQSDANEILKDFTDEELDELGDIALEELAKKRAEELLQERFRRKKKKEGKQKGEILYPERKS